MSHSLAYMPKTKDNQEQNRDLKAALLYLGYGVADVSGISMPPIGATPSQEPNDSHFLVVNLPNDPNFTHNLTQLSAHYGQDGSPLPLRSLSIDHYNDYSRGARMSIMAIYEGLRQKIDLRKFIPGHEH